MAFPGACALRKQGSMAGICLLMGVLMALNATSCTRAETVVGISGKRFTINGSDTFTAASGFPNAHPSIAGKVIMIKTPNCVFDDENYPDQGSRENPYGNISWDYPDGPWDPGRNTSEFIRNLPKWHAYGVRFINVNLQGNTPAGNSRSHRWKVAPWNDDGSLKAEYADRLGRVLEAADGLGMVVLVGIFYPNQLANLPGTDDATIRKCILSAMAFLTETGHRNVLVEISHDSDHPAYKKTLASDDRMDEAISYARRVSDGRFLVGSDCNARVPDSLISAADFFMILSANEPPGKVGARISAVASKAGNKPTFAREACSTLSMERGMETGSGWAIYHQGANNYASGIQAVPTNWDPMSSPGKWNIAHQIAQVTGSPLPARRPADLTDSPKCSIRGLADGEVVRDPSDYTIKVATPETLRADGLDYTLIRIEYFIDGRAVAYSGFSKKVRASHFTLSGSDLESGPFGFRFRDLPDGKHTLTALPYYRDLYAERTGGTADVTFITDFGNPP